MRDRTLVLKIHMEHLTKLDTSSKESQPGSGYNTNTNTTTKTSARKMHFKTCGTTGPPGPAKDDGLTSYNCGQVGHISRNCSNRYLMKKFLGHALVVKDAPNANSGPHLMTRKEEVHHPVETRVDGLPRRMRPTRRRTVRWRASWRLSRTWTLRREKSKEVSSCSCTTLKNTIMYSIVKQTGWQIGAR